MKKFVLCFVILSLFLVSCCYKNDMNNSDSLLYADTIVNSYGTGRIYDRSPAKYIDYDTMRTTVLCAKPNCTHTTNECVGVMIGDCPIIYNDYIYYFKYNHKVEETGKGERELKIKSQLCRISITTSEEEEIVTFTDCEPSDYNGWIIYHDKVYFTADNLNPQKNEYGAITLSNGGGIHYLCSIDLKTKEYKNYGSIYDGDKEYEDASYSSGAKINGMYQGKIMINYAFAKNVDIVDENEFPIFTVLMLEFDPQNETIVESNLPEAINDETMLNDIYIYTENNKTIVLNKGEEKIVNVDGGRLASCFNNKLFIFHKGIWIDLNDMSEHSMGKYSDGYQVIDYFDGCYILAQHLETVKITEDELLSLEKEQYNEYT